MGLVGLLQNCVLTRVGVREGQVADVALFRVGELVV